MGLQLLQLLAAVRSPGATDKDDDGYPGAEYIAESNFLPVPGPQCERRCHLANPQAHKFLGHLCSLASATRRLCPLLPAAVIWYLRCRRQQFFGHSLPVASPYLRVLCSYHRMGQTRPWDCSPS
jgi:hypothetical protein